MICELMALVYPQGSLANSLYTANNDARMKLLAYFRVLYIEFSKVRQGSNIIEHLLCVWYFVRHSLVLTVRLSGICNHGCYSIHNG